MPTRLAQLKIKRVATVDDGDNPLAEILLFKRRGGTAAVAATDEPFTKENEMADELTIEQLQEQLSAAEAAKVEAVEAKVALETQVAELTKRVDELTPPEPEPDPMEKASPEVKAEMEELRKQNKTQEDELAKMRDKDATEAAELVVKGLAYLPGVTPATVPLIKQLRALDKDVAGKVEKVLADANAALEASKALEATGHDGPGISDVEKRVDAEAAELIKSGLSEAQAKDRVWKSHPDWYTEYKQQREG